MPSTNAASPARGQVDSEPMRDAASARDARNEVAENDTRQVS